MQAKLNLHHLKILLAGPALGAGPVQRNHGPRRTLGYPMLRVARGLVINPAANQTHPGGRWSHESSTFAKTLATKPPANLSEEQTSCFIFCLKKPLGWRFHDADCSGDPMQQHSRSIWRAPARFMGHQIFGHNHPQTRPVQPISSPFNNTLQADTP